MSNRPYFSNPSYYSGLESSSFDVYLIMEAVATHNHLVRKRTLNHLAELAKWLSCVVSTYLHGAFDWCSYVTYAFQSESTLYSYLNITKFLARSWREIWSLRDCNWNSRTKWLWVWVQLRSLKLQILRLLRARSSLTFRPTIECGFTLKYVHDMIRTSSQMHRTDKKSQHNSIIWPPCLNGCVFAYELSGCGFESSCSHWNEKYSPL